VNHKELKYNGVRKIRETWFRRYG